VLPLGPIIPRLPGVSRLLRVAWIEGHHLSTDNASCSQIAQAARCGSWASGRTIRRLPGGREDANENRSQINCVPDFGSDCGRFPWPQI